MVEDEDTAETLRSENSGCNFYSKSILPPEERIVLRADTVLDKHGVK